LILFVPQKWLRKRSAELLRSAPRTWNCVCAALSLRNGLMKSYKELSGELINQSQSGGYCASRRPRILISWRWASSLAFPLFCSRCSDWFHPMKLLEPSIKANSIHQTQPRLHHSISKGNSRKARPLRKLCSPSSSPGSRYACCSRVGVADPGKEVDRYRTI